jgi:hypothetical protein
METAQQAACVYMRDFICTASKLKIISPYGVRELTVSN